eukprot:scaffold15513_cov144-Isochrysis_galbana.AAC.1
MPTITHVMTDLLVLRRAAHLMSEPVYIFGDDVKDYFNHLENAPEELWKCVITFLGDANDEDHRVRPKVGAQRDAIFVSERRMGFGLHPNSNVAQQLSEASARSRAVRPLSVLQCGRACCGRHECRRAAQVTATRYVRRWLMAALHRTSTGWHRVRDTRSAARVWVLVPSSLPGWRWQQIYCGTNVR